MYWFIVISGVYVSLHCRNTAR